MPLLSPPPPLFPRLVLGTIPDAAAAGAAAKQGANSQHQHHQLSLPSPPAAFDGTPSLPSDLSPLVLPPPAGGGSGGSAGDGGGGVAAMAAAAVEAKAKLRRVPATALLLLAEECLSLLVVLLTELPRPAGRGSARGSLRREVVHRLASSECTHSEVAAVAANLMEVGGRVILLSFGGWGREEGILFFLRGGGGEGMEEFCFCFFCRKRKTYIPKAINDKTTKEAAYVVQPTSLRPSIAGKYGTSSVFFCLSRNGR